MEAATENPFTADYWLGSVDPRPLALFRVLFGSVALFDLTRRLRDVPILYSDQGLSPRHALPQIAASWSLFRLVGSPWAVMLLYVAGLMALAALVLGYRTRVAQAATFVFLCSLHARNPVIASGPDRFMGAMSFWLLFADSGAAFSLDARFRNHAPARVAALGLRLLQWQFGLVCFFASTAKWSTWGDGLGVYRIAQLREYATPLASAVLAVPPLCIGLNWLVMGLEATVPLLLIPLAPLSPRWMRGAGILAGSALFLGILAFLRVGSYPEIMLAGLALFVLPEWLGPSSGQKRWTAARPAIRWVIWAVGVGQLSLVAWYLLASRCGLPKGRLVRAELHQIDLYQDWKMFAQMRTPPNIWWTDVGTLSDGREQEILASILPEIIAAQPSISWHEIRQKMEASEIWRTEVTGYACREFNRRSPVPLVELDLTLHVQESHDPRHSPNPERAAETYRQSCERASREAEGVEHE